ncbi:MAG: putative virulence factor [Clostridium sp.]|nr:putative virulence factor [Prevotella sp.]MCM1429048.1 putative virulence factor [Clostridium sp.]MCM1475421.1 putative virulence factor [Muribaculaceae bacterium]
MQQEINKQIRNVNDSLSWLKANKPEQYNARFLDLVEERRRLRKISEALREKPAIAAFGESQKGKSYLIGNLLQKDKKPFMVRSGETGEEVNFVMNINPIGDKKEATGVVTRFTSFTPGSDRFSDRYPVIVKLFSLANLITIFADSYYSDILDYKTYSEAEVEEFSTRILERYKNMSESANPPLTEDDILEIKSYLSKFAQAPTQPLRRSSYFDNLARIIRRVPQGEIAEVVQYLWHENETITKLFNRLATSLGRMNHASEVYTSLEAVRHYGDNRNTFMSVDCLNELDLSDGQRLTDVYVRDAGGNFIPVKDMPKCEICALCAETVYRIDERYLSDTEHYACEGPAGENGNIPAESMRKLTSGIDKTLLRDMDLLDFPGARNRLKIKASFLDQYIEKEGSSNAVQMLLRGKVAFLFNNYNESRNINMLLFCHDNEQPAVTDMYNMVDSWVNKYVGDTPARRSETISRYEGISPLFVVGTKFNVDMIEKDNPEHNNPTSLNQRWDGRFMKVLYTQVFKADSVDWFNNWNAPGETFKNTYMLRDFKYSGCTGSGNNLYEGYIETEETPRETRLRLSPAFYNDLRRSFVENAAVRKFFADPSLAWDVAATRNNDGALYIIDKLTQASRHAVDTREAQFDEEARSSARKVRNMMETFFVDTDADKILVDNIRKAAAIMRELDFTTNSDNYFFGHLLQGMMMTETETLSIVHKLIQSSELVSTTNDWKEYELIRRRCGDFEGCSSENDKWERLISTYFFRDREDAMVYLQRRNIDPKTLFSGDFKKKSNSATIADYVLSNWHSKLSSDIFRNIFSEDSGFDALVLSDLIENIKNNSRSLGLDRKMQSQVAEYVDIVNVANVNESLVADLLAGTINDFVRDMGFSLLSLEDRDNARRIAEKNRLHAFDYIERKRKSSYTDEEISAIFDSLHENPAQITPSFDNNYYSWLEYMLISFIARLEVPDYDKDANDALAVILSKM